jgi:TonB family protein
MIKRMVDRRASTRGGMTVSVAVHALLLLLLLVFAGRQASQVEVAEELVEIQYIEARYGEDVAAKVRLKKQPELSNDPGTGVSTRSAVQPSDARPEPPQADSRPRVAEVDAPDFAPAPELILPPAPSLEQKSFRKSRAPIVAMEDVKDPKILAEIAAPQAQRPASRERFRPQEGELAARNRTALDPDSDAVVGSLRSGGPSLATATDQADRILAGASLENDRGSYRGSSSGLAPAGGSGRGGSGGSGKGVVDIAGPSSFGGRESSGRRTILDYGTGSGGGGGGGGLVGRRTRLVEPPRPESIVEEAKPNETRPAVDDAVEALTGKGVSMTIAGQIKGRKILESSAPVYSEKARSNGWEGVVVVHFTVLPDGRVKDNTYFERTSAHRDLNRAAMDAIRKFRFAPLPSGERVEQWGLITIVFRLN